MKRILCVLVALLLAGSIALAEAIDLSSLSDDELSALQVSIADEIAKRKGDAATVGPWYDYGLGQYLPSFVDVTGNISIVRGVSWNRDNSFAEQFKGTNNDEFAIYRKALEQWGYNVNKSTSWVTYEASNADGIKVNCYIIGDQITLQADQK